MRKSNKKLMIVVSVLLSLVLITSSVVSGTMAKYVTSASTSESARGAKWGVNVEVEFSDAVKALCSDENEDGTLDEYVPVAKDGVLTVTLPNLPMAPGDDFTNAINLKITGRAEVRLRVTIGMDIDINNAFMVPNSIGNLANYNSTYTEDGSTLCVPISTVYNIFTTDNLSTPSAKYGPGWFVSSTNNAENIISRNFFGAMTTDSDLSLSTDSSGNYIATKSFAPGEEIVFHPTVFDRTVGTSGDFVIDDTRTIDHFGFGLKWMFERTAAGYKGAKIDWNEIETYIWEHNPKMSVTYIIKIEQI